MSIIPFINTSCACCGGPCPKKCFQEFFTTFDCSTLTFSQPAPGSKFCLDAATPPTPWTRTGKFSDHCEYRCVVAVGKCCSADADCAGVANGTPPDLPAPPGDCCDCIDDCADCPGGHGPNRYRCVLSGMQVACCFGLLMPDMNGVYDVTGNACKKEVTLTGPNAPPGIRGLNIKAYSDGDGGCTEFAFDEPVSGLHWFLQRNGDGTFTFRLDFGGDSDGAFPAFLGTSAPVACDASFTIANSLTSADNPCIFGGTVTVTPCVP